MLPSWTRPPPWVATAGIGADTGGGGDNGGDW